VSFLDDLIDEHQFNQHVNQGLMARIEMLIWYSSLDEREKARLIKQMLKLESEEEAWKLIKKLEEYQPVPGRDRVAITQYEIVEATRRRVELENFKERDKTNA
jgi:hypothetical protein